jgi:hypothetical protein
VAEEQHWKIALGCSGAMAISNLRKIKGVPVARYTQF